MLAPETLDQAVRLLGALRGRGWRLATAESCTGGLIAAALTQVAGSSDVFDRGWVTYSNASKTELLGVPAALIEAHGAVSEAVARAMAEGALTRSGAQIAVSVTGIAGPSGGSAEKPVGLVWFGCALLDRSTSASRRVFAGGRVTVRANAASFALGLVAEQVARAETGEATC